MRPMFYSPKEGEKMWVKRFFRRIWRTLQAITFFPSRKGKAFFFAKSSKKRLEAFYHVSTQVSNKFFLLLLLRCCHILLLFSFPFAHVSLIFFFPYFFSAQLCFLSKCNVFHFARKKSIHPTTSGGMQNETSVGICTHCIHVLARLVLSRCLITKFLHQSSVGSFLRVCCWLGCKKRKNHK